jgi:D-sedoheptulose 7-phosphate isomerase
VEGPDEAALEAIGAHLHESSRITEAVARECSDAIAEAARVVADSFRAGGKLLLCGNGGSAADSQHLAAEFVSVRDRALLRPALPAIALTTDTSFLTANANDFGFEDVFARQVEALGRAHDALIGISTSGQSANVIAALRRARDTAIKTIVFTGRTGGAMNDLGNVVIRVPSDSTQHIQESHIAIGHILCELVERSLFGDQVPAGERKPKKRRK